MNMPYALRRSAPPLMLAAVLILTATARSAEPTTAPGASLLNSRGIPGTLAVWGGGEVPEPIYGHVRKLIGADGQIDVLRMQWQPGSTADWERRQKAGEKFVEIPSLKAIDEQMVNSIESARNVWIDFTAPTAQVVDKLEPALRSVIANGGLVGGNLDGWKLIDHVLIDERFASASLSPTLTSALGDPTGEVGLAVSPGTLLTVAGRQVSCLGSAPAIWRFAPPAAATYGHNELLLKQPPGKVRDLLQLTRSAIARRDPSFPPEKPRPPKLDSNGTLLICGGGDLPSAIVRRFIQLAGGPDAPIVILPISQPQPDDPNPKALNMLKAAGATNLTVLNQHDPAGVNSPAFASAIKRATGVWFMGGRQWKYVDAYQGTVAEELFHDVLRRGGVIAGSSAGTAIQGDYMVRGDPLGNTDISCEGYEHGLATLPGTAIDIHVAQRDRTQQLVDLIHRYPQFLGIGIDEKTAGEVHGSVLTVLGPGTLRIVQDSRGSAADAKSAAASQVINLQAGAVFDLVKRETLRTSPDPTAQTRDD